MRPRIGVNLACERMEHPLTATASIHLRYLDALLAAGGWPVPIPPVDDPALLGEALAQLDGFCFIGGPDYHPEAYGGEPQRDAELVHPRRHRADLALARLALQGRLPLLAVCGGMQLLAIAGGGALVQDIATGWPDAMPHSFLARGATVPDDGWRHELRIAEGSRLARIVGGTTLTTNSYHHQTVAPRRTGGLTPVAWSSDGVIEAAELPGERFVLAVQWHPERHIGETAGDAIFAALVAACIQV